MATTKRLLDATARELATYTRDQKLAAIRGNEDVQTAYLGETHEEG